MLPKNQRIPKDLARNVFIRGSTISSPNFLLKFEKAGGAAEAYAVATRFAVSVSKKVAATAVLRNRTRRRVYSVLRDYVSNVRPGFLVAISVKKGGEKLKHPEISQEVKGLIEKSGLMK